MRQLVETRLQKLILIAAVMLLVSLIAAPLVLAQTQDWYLTNTTVVDYFYMDKGSPGTGAGIDFNTSSNPDDIWIANDLASINVTFPAATWSGTITMDPPNANDTYTGYIQVGAFHPPSTFTQVGPNSNTMSWPKGGASSQPYSISAPALTVPQGDYLALQFVYTGGRTVSLLTDSGSYLQYPVADPAYPVPDVKTWIFFAAGLAVVTGILFKIRRKPLPSPTTLGL